MLSDIASQPIVAVSDLERARRFYRDTLGLELLGEGMGVLVFRTGSTRLNVYASEFAGTNRANAVVWDAGAGIEAIVATLREKGVTFERYEMDGAEYRDGIHHADGMKLSWFKDPDGNILHLNQMPAGDREAGR